MALSASCLSTLLVYLGIREFVHLYLWLRSTYLVRRHFDLWGGDEGTCHKVSFEGTGYLL